MPSTFSPLLRIELIGQGEQSNTWGTTTNTNLGTLIEQAIAGAVTITLLNANYTLTESDGSSDESRRAIILVSGTQTQERTILIPDTSKVYIFRNVTSGGFPVRIQRQSGGGFVSIPNNKTALVMVVANFVVFMGLHFNFRTLQRMVYSAQIKQQALTDLSTWQKIVLYVVLYFAYFAAFLYILHLLMTVTA